MEPCPGMSEFRWLSRAGPALPAWQCLSDRDARCLTGCFKDCHCTLLQSAVAVEQVPDLQRSLGGTAELHHSCSARCSGAAADSDPAQCMQLLAGKTQT